MESLRIAECVHCKTQRERGFYCEACGSYGYHLVDRNTQPTKTEKVS